MTVKLILWRHGQTDWNATGKFQGQFEVPINELGRDQARAAAPYLAAFAPDRIISSDLGRAQETAGFVAELTGLPIEIDARLREMDTGDWTGLTFEETIALDPAFEVAVREGRDYRRSGGGETIEETAERCSAALYDIAQNAVDGQTLVVVGHGLSWRVSVAWLLGMNFKQSWTLGGLHNCAWTVLSFKQDRVGPYGPWSLLSYNLSVADMDLGPGAHATPIDVAAPDQLQGPPGP